MGGVRGERLQLYLCFVAYFGINSISITRFESKSNSDLLKNAQKLKRICMCKYEENIVEDISHFNKIENV